MMVLGPKSDFYRSLAREQWGPISERSEVRHSLFWFTAGSVLLIGGLIGVAVTGEALTAIIVGLLACSMAWKTWSEHRHFFRAWRQIGDVTLVGPPLDHVPGDVSAVTLRITPRTDGALQLASFTFSWRDSRSGPASTAWAVDAELGDLALRAGEVRELMADVSLPPGVPPSRFDSGWTRQWTCSARLELADGRVWDRDYPVFVYPTP